MKIIAEFNLPEEQSLLDEYNNGIKLLWFMQRWVQESKWKIENGITALDLLDDLNKGIEDEKINLFNG